MQGHRPPSRPGGGGSGGGGSGSGSGGYYRPPPPSQPPLNSDTNFFLQNQNFYLQNLANTLHQNFLHQQNFNGYFPFLNQNSNFPIQNPNYPIPQQQLFLPQQLQQQQNYNNFQFQNPNLPQQNLIPQQTAQNSCPETSKTAEDKIEQQQELSGNVQNDSAQQQQQQQKQDQKSVQRQELQQMLFHNPKKKIPKHKQQEVDRVNVVVAKVWKDLLAAKESVSAWKVSQAALVELQVESWDALGFPMQSVPSLHGLILTEGKINSFIHCFAAVRRIASLYDLEAAICENEGIERFEELELGPLLRHPLVLHYFSVNCDTTEVPKITTEDVILSLHEYMDTSKEKEVIVDEFLDFIAKKRSVNGKGNLGVRIQSLGMHIKFILEAKRSKNTNLKKCLSAISAPSSISHRKTPNLQKKDIDVRFSDISRRIESFGYAHMGFQGKHIRFDSSSSEDEESNDSMEEDKMIKNGDRNHFSLQNVNNTDKVSTCPYPSATEEMSRLGLKGETSSQSTLRKHKSHLKRINDENTQSSLERKKRRFEELSSKVFAPSTLLKGDNAKHNIHPLENGDKNEVVSTISERSFSLSMESLVTFITTWKDACKEHSVNEVLQKMVDFYKPLDVRGGRRIKSHLYSFPSIGLLNVAVEAMKSGMLDSMYDALQSVTQLESLDTFSSYESIDVEPAEKHGPAVNHHKLMQTQSVTVQEILEKITRYYELDHKLLTEGNFISLKKLCSCELWLVEQFGIKEFKFLGHGEFLNFIWKHASLLPTELQELFAGNVYKKPPLEVSMLQHQLMFLLSQASNNLWDGETISKQMISALLINQFPLIGFKVVENTSMDEFLKAIDEYKNDVVSKSVQFSATLLGEHYTGDTLREDHTVETAAVRVDRDNKMTVYESITSQKAVEVLLRAPMLSDLKSWSHWDLIYAPSLGPLVGWLSSEVNTKELSCLVTKDGKVIRINQSANPDSFLEAALQRSSYQTAVELLSVLSLAGGEKHVPLSLLKCYAGRAFDVSFKNHFENVDFQENKNYLSRGEVVDKVANNLSDQLDKSLIQLNQAVSAASRFILNTLGSFPSEFCGFAADVLLSGMLSVNKDARSAILCECNIKERIMLHEIGLSIGIVEWIDDYHKFCSTSEPELEDSRTVLSTASGQNAPDMYSCGYVETTLLIEEDEHNEESTETSPRIQDVTVFSDATTIGCAEKSSMCNKQKDAALVIESIRRDEFGLDPNISSTESTILRKQHARLGRALHCLSQELYSEDSHFLLELVQNADDNIYPESVEPTLTFILQESGIVVLNNEEGFSAQNIRALCDVGNSTKKGSGAGYIGQKGIGFKSVFRVTDAPQIHSNGFHIKFDISEGQIGFVLPTAVPACNVDLFSRLVSGEAGQKSTRHWNTCMLLPFRSKLSEETAMKMFSDLHASLLLFLHRLQCIMFRNMLKDTLFVMRKEILENGIVRVYCGKDKMTWLVSSQKLQAHVSRPKVQSTEIALAFTLEESDSGVYYPRLDQQPVFAFLPLRTYGLKFILQGDFVLPSSREEVDKNDPWNEWLLTQFPGLFISAERSFCALSCFRDNPGKAVAAYMSFVPLVGEVHGFFSGLPKAIALALRRTSCLLLEGDNCNMVPPCNVLRGWNEQARFLLPDDLLQEHLALGFLDKNIVLSDSLARALGIAEYGPEILVKFITCLSRTKNGLKSMGLGWLSSLLNTLYGMLCNSSGPSDIIDNLRKIPFVPLSDGTFSALDGGTIWLYSDTLSLVFDGARELEAFPQLYARLRTVDSALFSVSAVDRTLADNMAKMLLKIGVQQLSAHEIVKVHVLPALCNAEINDRNETLMIDYLCFVMIHLQSSCPHCCVERKDIISELQHKAYILTNFGYKRPSETPLHFSKKFGNPIDVNKLINVADMQWHEVDIAYLKHPINDSLSNELMKWRVFFQEIGVTDFVQVIQMEKNISDILHTVLKDVKWDAKLLLPGSVSKDWESCELAQLLSILSGTGNKECCKYLLEILDTVWDDSFSDKTSGYCNSEFSADSITFKSSFLGSIHDVPWVVSTMDNKLHYPKDLFYDCDAVRSVLGSCAPYALPKVRSSKLLSDIGFKTKVTLDDALEILRVWTESETPFKASIGQMSKFYTFIWDEIAASKNQISEALHLAPFIFIPYESGSRHDVLVSGVFLTSKEVYWHDPTGSTDHMKEIHPGNSLTELLQRPLSKTLCNIYTGLHDFFVKECGVHEIPSCRSYLDILKQLSTFALPSQAAGTVFQVFLKWSDDLKSGLLSSTDIIYMKECLLKLECTVLPTVGDKWVSLHSSFGLLCWCDDKKLKKRFKDKDNIDFLYLGDLSDKEEDMLRDKMSELLQGLGIPALSKIVTREAIFYGPVDSSFKALLVDWALPYAQRYIYSVYPETYFQLKQDSGFSDIKQLKVTVVEKLFYRNVIKSCNITSKKRYECSCHLQGNTLYVNSESDSHALFLELSRLFFDGSSNLQLANFLHMIKTMAESGSTEDQTEFFIANSQKVPKLPDDESTWSLPSFSSLTEIDDSLEKDVASVTANEHKSSKSNVKLGRTSNWPPADWKTAPGFDYARAHGFNTQPAVSHPKGSGHSMEDDSEDISAQIETLPIEIDATWTIEENSVGPMLDSDYPDGDLSQDCDQSVNVDNASRGRDRGSSKFLNREKLITGTPNAAQLSRTGRLGEQVAFRYLSEKFGKKLVKWVNEDNETGLPYDIVIGEDENSRQYYEVKATTSSRKDWFIISTREWQFAVDNSEAFSIVYVVLSRNNAATVTIFPNPVKRCKKGELQLVVMMPNQKKESTLVSV
ncbi:protein NO VEIN [Mercurialis annua]|uniref:protein NO VEIN n=1 Tax=Mercurialis annua TaxID=3986 RepID=UPI00215F6CBE|nr:protein NO VEIN [Mercurialis annua]